MKQTYSYNHRRLRKQLAPIVAQGDVPCWRCSELIGPGELWDLGHKDDGTYAGPEHEDCNRKAGGKKGADNLKKQKEARRDRSVFAAGREKKKQSSGYLLRLDPDEERDDVEVDSFTRAPRRDDGSDRLRSLYGGRRPPWAR